MFLLGFGPTFLVPSGFVNVGFLQGYSSSVLNRCPNHLTLVALIYGIISGSSYNWYYSKLYQIRHSPFPFVGPYVLLNTFLSNVPIFMYTITELAFFFLLPLV